MVSTLEDVAKAYVNDYENLYNKQEEHNALENFALEALYNAVVFQTEEINPMWESEMYKVHAESEAIEIDIKVAHANDEPVVHEEVVEEILAEEDEEI